jgi:uncharacterized repeat protein (TIGR02543 family)
MQGTGGVVVSDCYTVAGAHGTKEVGGFFGKAQGCTAAFTRCYAAGGDTAGTSDVGGFAGAQSGGASLSFTDCFRLMDGHADVGTDDLAGIVALDAAEMRSTNNFTAFQAAGCWKQVDGLTQPYFDWGLVDGKFLLLAGDTATATVNGLGAYAPGTDVQVSIYPTDGIFLGWTGGATYANASANETTVLLDNYHVVSVTLGTRITTRAQLEAISSNLSGAYGLAADINLSVSPWTPIGSSDSPFTGKLYGRGHKIIGLTFDNTSSDDSAKQVGLFRCINGATIDGVHLEGVSIKGYERCGALAGEVGGASTIRNCSAQGSVSGAFSYIGLLAGYISGSGVLFEGCATTGSVSAVGSDAGGFVGYAKGGSAAFTDCHACADVSGAGLRDSRGGFISAIIGGGSFAFSRCTAEGTVSAFRNEQNLGGFIAYVGRPASFTDCSANVSVSYPQSQNQKTRTGGFAGYIGDRAAGSSFLRCTAEGDVSSTGEYVGGFVGSSEREVSFTDCRADGHVGGNGSVGGFAGNVSAPLVISNCVARGDVRSTGDNYGGFVGCLANADAVVSDSWCSGAVWGTGGYIGSFVGKKADGTIRNCSVDVYGAGPRPFCGSDASMTGGSLTGHQVEALSKDGNGTPWPEVKQRFHGAWKIRTAEDLANVSTNLAGVYVLDSDIDLGGAAWTPIGNASDGFTGEFYGQNHRISNFVVDTEDRYAGFFGRIAGGRVSGVALEGTVTAAPPTSLESEKVGVGGFAGKIDSKSLVEDCSFKGAVTNSTNSNVGGFVGSVSDSPVILRCCVLRATVANTSSQSDAYAGGFVAWLDGGYVMDCYAVADVEADNKYVGGFAGLVNGSITNAYCVGSVTVSGSNHGAFAGYSIQGSITISYYDSDKADGLGAVNGSPFAGVTGLSSAQMLHAANFDFDFDRTWQIKEGETTPYLRTTPLAPFADGDIVLADCEAVYDGEGHTIGVSVTNAIAWVSLRYCGIGVGELSTLNFELSTPPLYTDVTNVTVWVEASAPGYFTTTNSATVKITPRPVTFTGQSETNAYTGSEIVITNLVVTNLVAGHAHNVSFSASGTDVGTHTGAITARDDVRITDGGTDVTGNYDITVVNGALTIEHNPALGLEVSLGGGSFTYDGQPHAISGPATHNALSGTTTVEYSKDQSNWTADLSALTATDVADSCTIHVRATNPNYANTATTTAALTITKAANAWITAPSMKGWTASATPATPNKGKAKFGTATVAYGKAGGAAGALGATCPSKPGNYTATFTVPGTANYAGLTKTISFTISPKTYKVKFKANGGKLQKGKKMAAQTYTTGKAKKLRKNKFTRKGYVFIGWSTRKNGPVAYKNGQKVKNLAKASKTVTLYAAWAKAEYKVVFDASGGKLPKGVKMPAQTFKYGKAQKLSKNKFIRKGYVFRGWAIRDPLATIPKIAYKDKQMVKNLSTDGKSVKLYAVWKRR